MGKLWYYITQLCSFNNKKRCRLEKIYIIIISPFRGYELGYDTYWVMSFFFRINENLSKTDIYIYISIIILCKREISILFFFISTYCKIYFLFTVIKFTLICMLKLLTTITIQELKVLMDNLPSNDDETIQFIPRIIQICWFPINSHCNHFDDHFYGKECKDEVIKVGKNVTSYWSTNFIFTWLVHS